MEQQVINFIKDIPNTNLTKIQKIIKNKFSNLLFNQFQLNNQIDINESIVLLIPELKDIYIIALVFDDGKIYLEKEFLCDSIEFFKILIEDMIIENNFMTEIKVCDIKYDIMMIILEYLDTRKIICNKKKFTDLFFTVHYLLNVNNMMQYLILNFNNIYHGIFADLLKDPKTGYQLIYNYCDILSKHNQSNEYILTILKTVDLLISENLDLFFTSSLYHYILSLDIEMVHDLIIKHQYYPMFKPILSSDNVDQLVELLLKNNQINTLKILHQSNAKMIENAIISCWDYIPKELYELPFISDDLFLALILKYNDYDHLRVLTIKHPTVLIHLTMEIQKLLDNFTILSLLHKNLGKVFEDRLISLIDELQPSIFKMSIENFSDELIWVLILKFNQYQYISLLSPTNKYDIPSTKTFNIFVNFISTLLKNNPDNMYDMIKNLYQVFGIIIENVLISLIEDLSEQMTDHLDLYSNELILLLIVKFDDLKYLSILKQPLVQLSLSHHTINYLFSNQFTIGSGNLSKFITNHMDYIEKIYPIFYTLLVSTLDDQMIKHNMSEKLMKYKIVSHRFQSILDLTYGALDEVRQVKFDKNDKLIQTGILSIINHMTNKKIRHEENLKRINQCCYLFLEYSNQLRNWYGLSIPSTIHQVLNFIPDIKIWQYLGQVQPNGNLVNTKLNYELHVNQSILIKDKKGYYIDKIKQLIIRDIEVNYYFSGYGNNITVVLENYFNQSVVLYI